MRRPTCDICTRRTGTRRSRTAASSWATGMRPRAACAAPALTAERHRTHSGRRPDLRDRFHWVGSSRRVGGRIWSLQGRRHRRGASAPPRSPSPTRCRRPCIGLARRTSCISADPPRTARRPLLRHRRGWLRARDHVTGDRPADGTVLAADVVVESVGSVANTEWARRQRPRPTDGVSPTSTFRVGGRPTSSPSATSPASPAPATTARPAASSTGPSPDTASHAAKVLAAHLAGTDADLAPFGPLPTFWSDQHDLRPQSLRRPCPRQDDMRVSGTATRRRRPRSATTGRTASSASWPGRPVRRRSPPLRYRAELPRAARPHRLRNPCVPTSPRSAILPPQDRRRLVPDPRRRGATRTCSPSSTAPTRPGCANCCPNRWNWVDEDPGTVALIWADWQSCSADGHEPRPGARPVQGGPSRSSAASTRPYLHPLRKHLGSMKVTSPSPAGLHPGLPEEARLHPPDPPPPLRSRPRARGRRPLRRHARRRRPAPGPGRRHPARTVRDQRVRQRPPDGPPPLAALHREGARASPSTSWIARPAPPFEGGQPWAGDAELELFEAPTEELGLGLEVREPTGASLPPDRRQSGTAAGPWSPFTHVRRRVTPPHRTHRSLRQMTEHTLTVARGHRRHPALDRRPTRRLRRASLTDVSPIDGSAIGAISRTLRPRPPRPSPPPQGRLPRPSRHPRADRAPHPARDRRRRREAPRRTLAVVVRPPTIGVSCCARTAVASAPRVAHNFRFFRRLAAHALTTTISLGDPRARLNHVIAGTRSAPASLAAHAVERAADDGAVEGRPGARRGRPPWSSLPPSGPR